MTVIFAPSLWENDALWLSTVTVASVFARYFGCGRNKKDLKFVDFRGFMTQEFAPLLWSYSELESLFSNLAPQQLG